MVRGTHPTLALNSLENHKPSRVSIKKNAGKGNFFPFSSRDFLIPHLRFTLFQNVCRHFGIQSLPI
jgi:hypothetical protein